MESDRSKPDLQNIADLLHRSTFSEHLQHFALPASEILWAIHRPGIPDKLLLLARLICGVTYGIPLIASPTACKSSELLGSFQQVPGSADAQGLCGQIRIGIHSQNDQLNVRHEPFQLFSCLEAVQ